MESLEAIYNKHKKGDWPDKGSVHSYIEFYEVLLKPYRHTAKKVLEIGLMSGESLRMWAEYFDGEVHGMDCTLQPIDGVANLVAVMAEGYNVRIGDAANAEDVKNCFDGYKFDVIIEDAEHSYQQQVGIYITLKPYLNDGGIYIIEDIQDIDKTKHLFRGLGGEIIDRRHIKNRYDDVLVIIRK